MRLVILKKNMDSGLIQSLYTGVEGSNPVVTRVMIYMNVMLRNVVFCLRGKKQPLDSLGAIGRKEVDLRILRSRFILSLFGQGI